VFWFGILVTLIAIFVLSKQSYKFTILNYRMASARSASHAAACRLKPVDATLRGTEVGNYRQRVCFSTPICASVPGSWLKGSERYRTVEISALYYLSTLDASSHLVVYPSVISASGRMKHVPATFGAVLGPCREIVSPISGLDTAKSVAIGRSCLDQSVQAMQQVADI
jgi:hypothetical protein